MQHFFFNREMLAIPDTGLCFQDPVIQDQQYFNVKQSLDKVGQHSHMCILFIILKNLIINEIIWFIK